MLGEDLTTSKEALQDLLMRESDAPIFQRLNMTYGQAVRFKSEMSQLLPYDQRRSKGNHPWNHPWGIIGMVKTSAWEIIGTVKTHLWGFLGTVKTHV